MLVKLIITSTDGSGQILVRKARLGKYGPELDGPSLQLRDGDRVAWASDVPGIRGAFSIDVQLPLVH